MALALWLSRRFVLDLSRRAALLIALLPLVFTGRALFFGDLYGPSDLYYTAIPWKPLAAAEGVGAPANPILSDLAFANLPWRAAVREAFANGRLPLWNRFVLAGNPLLATAQAGAFHPSTWLGLWLPVPLSWTFSCTFTLFLALLAGFLFFRGCELTETAALIGAVGWGFSTYVLFWLGWSVGPSTATFPLLLLGLRRLARRPDRRSVALTVAALWLAVCGGHPESLLHGVAAGGVYFAWELFASRGAAVLRSIGAALGAGVLAALLAGPQLLPLLEAIPHSAEYRARREAVRKGVASQSVPAPEAVRRLLPDLLPFAHGIYGRSAVQTSREDGSGMPLGYAGALLFPLAVLSFVGGTARGLPRGRWIFLAFALAGAGFGASFPGLLDATTKLPGFALALNYRLVFIAGLGLAGLAALGAQTVLEEGGRERLLRAAAGVVVVLGIVFLVCLPVYTDRGLDRRFVLSSFGAEVVPVVLVGLAAGAARLRSRALLDLLLACLVLQRFLEMRSTYPTMPAATLAPPLPTLAALPLGSDPCRIVAGDDVFRPNGSALYGLEDVRGYESLVLDRFADTWPLWSQAQAASFNRVPDLTKPFLSFLNARYAFGASDDETPAGWREQARGPEMAIFENPSALPRAFVPRHLRRVADARRRLEEMAGAMDFSETAWLSAGNPSEQVNGDAQIHLQAVGPDLVVTGRATSPTLVATSLPDWPGWAAEEEGGRSLRVETVDHAFVGFWLPAGEHSVRLTYRPRSWNLGLAAFGAGLVLAGVLSLALRPATGRRSAS